jgi:hypothetical protein
MPPKAMILLGLIPLVAACTPLGPAAPAPTAAPAVAPSAAPPVAQARRPAGASTTWRVAQDGTTGCADPAMLHVLREPATDAAALRRLAAARTEGGCVTAFRTQGWRLVERAGEIIRLTPAEAGAGPGPLHFWRDQVVEDRAV